MSDGWIKLHRKILDNPTLKDWQARSVFIELLLRATHKPHTIDRKGHQIELQTGQLVTTERLLADDLKIGRQVIRRILALLKNRTMVETETNPVGTLITICNWGKYQGHDEPSNPGPTQHPTQDQPRTNPHYKKGKNEKNESIQESVPSGLVETASPNSTPARPHKQIAENMVRVFNHHLGDVLQRAKVTPKRVRTLSTAFKDDFNDDGQEWSTFCQRVATSDFLTGRKSDWRASLDWIIKPANRTKILEGNYDNRQSTNGIAEQALRRYQQQVDDGSANGMADGDDEFGPSYESDCTPGPVPSYFDDGEDLFPFSGSGSSEGD